MEFNNWLVNEMNKRGWNINDLARASGISRGALGNIIRGERYPGTDVCNGIARAFKLPPEQVFRYAGLLPETKTLDELSPEMGHIWQLLDEQERENLIQFGRFRLQVQDEKPKYTTTKRDTPTTPRP